MRRGESRRIRWSIRSAEPRQEVVRVRQLEDLVREAAGQVAELVAEVDLDVVAQRFDVGSRGRLVVDRRTGATGANADKGAWRQASGPGGGLRARTAALDQLEARGRRQTGPASRLGVDLDRTLQRSTRSVQFPHDQAVVSGLLQTGFRPHRLRSRTFALAAGSRDDASLRSSPRVQLP